MCERTSRVVPVGGGGAATGTDRQAEATGGGRKASYRRRQQPSEALTTSAVSAIWSVSAITPTTAFDYPGKYS